MYPRKWNRGLIKKLLEDAPDCDDPILWVALEYERATGVRIEKATINDLNRRGMLTDAPQKVRGWAVKRYLMDEIIHQDPWIIAYPQRAYEAYRQKAGSPACTPPTIARYLRHYGVKIAMESPHYDETVIETVRERKLLRYVIPVNALADLEL